MLTIPWQVMSIGCRFVLPSSHCLNCPSNRWLSVLLLRLGSTPQLQPPLSKYALSLSYWFVYNDLKTDGVPAFMIYFGKFRSFVHIPGVHWGLQ